MSLQVWRVYTGLEGACAEHRIVVAHTREEAITISEDLDFERGLQHRHKAEPVCAAIVGAHEVEAYSG